MSSSEEFLKAFAAATDVAVSHAMRLSIVTKAGEIIEGVPTSVAMDATNSPASVTPSDEHHLYGSPEHTVEIDGQAILAQEVAQFSLTLR